MTTLDELHDAFAQLNATAAAAARGLAELNDTLARLQTDDDDA